MIDKKRLAPNLNIVRPIKKIEIEGKSAIAIFDTGSSHTYVVKKLLEKVPMRKLPEPYRVGLGGKIIEVKEKCVVIGRIEGYSFDAEAVSVDDLGKVDGKKIDVIIGADTMERWEIIINPKDGSLDLSKLKEREFTEYL